MKWNNPEKKHGRFVNPHIKDCKRNLLSLLLWRLGFYDEQGSVLEPPEDFLYPAAPAPCDWTKPTAVWIGHSTYLLQVGGMRFLTDPVFSSYCSPVPIKGLKRQHAPAVAIGELPSIDCILLSHNHYDHLDEKSIRVIHRSNPQAVWVVPHGVKRWFIRHGIDNVRELGWGDSVEINGCMVHAVPSQHFSGRGLWDKNKTLWCGYVVEVPKENKVFYFVGDTGYNQIDFKDIGKRWTPDLSLIPIGTYVPKVFMQPVHISPYEAVEIHRDVGSRLSVGMHWNTFLLSDEPQKRPPYDLFLAMQARRLPFETFLPLGLGEGVNW